MWQAGDRYEHVTSVDPAEAIMKVAAPPCVEVFTQEAVVVV